MQTSFEVLFVLSMIVPAAAVVLGIAMLGVARLVGSPNRSIWTRWLRWRARSTRERQVA